MGNRQNKLTSPPKMEGFHQATNWTRTDCQKERNTTALTTANLAKGLIGLSSSLVALNMSTKQYSAQVWEKLLTMVV